MQQTNQYKLNLIENADAFSPQPINENTEAIEAALDAQNEERERQISKLQETIDAVRTGSLQVSSGSYIGTDDYGSNSPNSLTFSFKPYVVIVSQENNCGYFGVWIRGTTEGRSFSSGSTIKSVKLDWNDNGISWYYADSSTSGSGYQLNVNGWTYRYIAIGLN